eukprot:CAMPEP_0114414278 /NCGR_PEP_ID=MMETSP0103-20121206/1304_1 /TAXON_ID=37642 ORGANISM="Paraphysomonas imperforata, Strain PA2" /NCGR_SAMPLE_ID=MMETSP0103 /ASSEMBLY_ACC=CAM_ASM_000201 /LENGTH=289 /DNA_ID=CAMNT_0001582411 /DNA_START=54 /DNA_END=923 /DNA_ORIENTATION=+
MPTAQRNAKSKEKKDSQVVTEKEEDVEVEVNNVERDSSKDAVHKLVYDYLLSEDFSDTAKSFLKDANVDAKVFEGGEESAGLSAMYAAYVSNELENKKKSKRKTHDLLSGVGDAQGDGKDDGSKKKRKRSSSQKKEGGSGSDEGSLVMKEESQKQYTFGWKRYNEYCQIHNLNTLIGDKASPSTQILEFARYLMQNPGKTVKSAVANSYVSAVGKKLLEANVITAMRDIRTPELKELFAEAGRAAAAASASSSSSAGTTTIATASTAAPLTASSNGGEDSQDSKKKKRV